MIENKEIMAKNIKRYMSIKGVTAAELCDALAIKRNTFSDWVNAKTFPRIDKIEMLAKYFECSKADLVEDYNSKVSTSQDYANIYANDEIAIIEWYRNASKNERDMIMRIIDKPKEQDVNKQVRVIPVTVAAAPHSLKEIAGRNADILLQNAVRMDRGDFNGKVHKAQRRSLRNKG